MVCRCFLQRCFLHKFLCQYIHRRFLQKFLCTCFLRRYFFRRLSANTLQIIFLQKVLCRCFLRRLFLHKFLCKCFLQIFLLQTFLFFQDFFRSYDDVFSRSFPADVFFEDLFSTMFFFLTPHPFFSNVFFSGFFSRSFSADVFFEDLFSTSFFANIFIEDFFPEVSLLIFFAKFPCRCFLRRFFLQ